MNNYQLLNSGIQIASIAVWGFILKYIMDLDTKGCKCADSWQRKFIEYYIIVGIILSILRLINFNIDMPPSVLTLYFVVTVAFVIIVYHYIQKLKVTNCECSVDVMRDILEVANYLQIGLMAFIIILAIHIVMTIGTALNKSENQINLNKSESQ